MNEQVFWLAINIYHEARGEPLSGMVAVGHVVINRSIRKQKAVKEIILEPSQFSWTLEGRPPIKDYDALLRSITAAKLTVRQRLEGVTLNHSDHYYNYKTIDKPVWAMDMREVAKVGQHVFFRS